MNSNPPSLHSESHPMTRSLPGNGCPPEKHWSDSCGLFKRKSWDCQITVIKRVFKGLAHQGLWITWQGVGLLMHLAWRDWEWNKALGEKNTGKRHIMNWHLRQLHYNRRDAGYANDIKAGIFRSIYDTAVHKSFVLKHLYFHCLVN